ncbi:MAG: nucleoside deaminase [Ardenticatenaceae bacterium]|nr:nucleoside deaminase [Ardenticatenaceae bacterium]
MQIALAQAEEALNQGDFPVGAVLMIEGQLAAQERNHIFSQQRSAAHAETTLLVEHSAVVRAAYKAGKEVVLYSTLEPCLMCLGMTLVHHIPKIVVACPDPMGGATRLDPQTLGGWYVNSWPHIEMGLYREASWALLMQFLRKADGRWQPMLHLFEKMYTQWQDNPL